MCCDEVLERDGVKMPRKNFVWEYMKIHNQSFKESTITAAFKTTGIYPFNCDCLSEKAYVPSYSFSTHAHVPPSYPLLSDGTQTQWTYNNSDDDSDSDSGDDNDDTNPSHQP
jgi:hypothetical protein